MQHKHQRDDFLKKYHETRTQFLDGKDQEKLKWFRRYFDTVYATYFKKVGRDKAILELGCNKGYLLNVLAEEGYTNLVGVDLSEGDIEVARRLNPGATIIQEDIFTFLEKMPESFDVILLKALIEHIEKDRIMELLEKIHRALKQGGFILIDVYNADWVFTQHDRYMDFTHEVGFTQESLKQVMVFFYKDVSVTPVSGLIFNSARRFLCTVSRKILKKLLEFLVDPDLKEMALFERVLIGYGKK